MKTILMHYPKLFAISFKLSLQYYNNKNKILLIRKDFNVNFLQNHLTQIKYQKLPLY